MSQSGSSPTGKWYLTTAPDKMTFRESVAGCQTLGLEQATVSTAEDVANVMAFLGEGGDDQFAKKKKETLLHENYAFDYSPCLTTSSTVVTIYIYEGCFTKKYNFLITSSYISLERQGLVIFFFTYPPF